MGRETAPDRNKGGRRVTERQKRFADEYLIDLDIGRAYMAAYPAVKHKDTASAAGSRLLNDVKYQEVQDYVREKLDEIQSKKIMTAQEVLEYLSSVVRGKSSSEIVVIEGQGVGVTEARHVTKAPDEKERLKAAELLAKYHQLMTPKVETAGQGGGVILMPPVMTE